MDDKERIAWMARVEAQLDNLPPEDAVIVRLRLFDGFTVAEVGKALGISERRVVSRLKKGLRTIRARLEAERGEDPGPTS